MALRSFCRSAPLVAAGFAALLASAAAKPVQAQTVQEKLNRIGADLFSPTPHAAEAIKELQAILAADPGLAEGHLLLGIAYRAQGSPELMSEAVAELRQAIALKPSLLLARLVLARVYLDLARPSRAREELDAALAEAPGRPELLSLLGEVERQMGNPRRSIELNRQVLKEDASFVQARYYLGLALLEVKQHTAAIRELELVARAGANPAEAYLALGAAYLDAGRVDAALDALGKAAEADPMRPQTRIRLARAYRLKGRLDDAVRELELAKKSASGGLAVLYQNFDADLRREEGLVKAELEKAHRVREKK